MQHRFFRFLGFSALFGGVVVAIFLVLVFLIYQNPLNSTSKGLDTVLFIMFPLGVLLYYKLRANQGLLDFQEGFVLVMLTGACMLIFFCATIALLCTLNPYFLTVFNDLKYQEVLANKKMWLERVKTEEDYKILLLRAKNQTIGMYLFGEVGIKIILISTVALVSATGFRKS